MQPNSSEPTLVKSARKAGVVGWSQCEKTRGCLAVATWAGATTDFASATSSELELFSLDLESPSQDLKSLGRVDPQDKFWKICWGAPNKGTNGHGLIAGAMASGHVSIWDAGAIINNSLSARTSSSSSSVSSPQQQPQQQALVKSISKHKGVVRSVQFNPFQNHLLASGGDFGEIFMFDVNNPSLPVVYNPISAAQNSHTISSLAWSLQFEHILAGTSLEGWTLVWDLRQKRVAVQFANEGKRLSSVLWHPEAAMEMVVACENDDAANAVLQVWDLRSAFAPKKILRGHERGIVSASWCPDDPALLVSCGRDNHTICWNPESGEKLCEIPSCWNFDVQWAPNLPATLSVSAIGPPPSVGVYSLLSISTKVGDNGRPTPPKWLRRPCGATFGFGGQLFSFTSNSQNLHTNSVVTDTELLNWSHRLENAMQNSTLPLLCEEKSTQLQNSLKTTQPHETAKQKQLREGIEIWGIMGACCNNNNNYFSQQTTENENPSSTREKILSVLGMRESEVRECAKAWKSRDQVQKPHEIEVRGEWGEVEVLVKGALLVGDTETAVDLLMEHGRTSEALVLAASAEPSLGLWEKTRNAYLTRLGTDAPFQRLLNGLLRPDLSALIGCTDGSNWRETLAVLITYASQNDLPQLCNQLAANLEAQGETHGTLITAMCGGNVNKVVKLWLTNLSAHSRNGGEGGGNDFNGNSSEELLEAMGRIAVFRKSHPGSVGEGGGEGVGEEDFAALHFCRYAELLVSQGVFVSAMSMLTDIPNVPQSMQHRVAVLRDRIFRSNASLFPNISPPDFPFSYSPLTTTTTTTNYPNTNQQQYYQQQHFQQQQQPYYSQTQPHNTQFPTTTTAQQPQQIYTQLQPMQINPITATTTLTTTNTTNTTTKISAPGSNNNTTTNPSVVGGNLLENNNNNNQGPSRVVAAAPISPLPTTTTTTTMIGGVSNATTAQHTQQQQREPGPGETLLDVCDVTNVGGAISVVNAFRKYAQRIAASQLTPVDRRKLDDTVKRLVDLFEKLNLSQLTPETINDLNNLCQVLDQGNTQQALEIQKHIQATAWDGNNKWLVGIKQLISLFRV